MKKKEFVVILYHGEDLNLNQSIGDHEESKENIDEKFEIYPLAEFYKSKVKQSEKEEESSDIEYILMKYDKNRSQWVGSQDLIYKPAEFSDSLILHKFLTFNVNRNSQSADRKEEDKVFEYCHNDFINPLEDLSSHNIEHEMALIVYCNRSETWKMMCKFSSQEKYQHGDTGCAICHIPLKQRKVKYICQDCVNPSTGLFKSYCYDHRELEHHMQTPH